MTEISSTHTMKLKLNELLASPQQSHEAAAAVTSQEVPARVNFKRSNTCGSFFAKCQCREPHSSEIGVVASKSLSLDATSPHLSRVPSILVSSSGEVQTTKSEQEADDCDNKVRKESPESSEPTDKSHSRSIKKQPSFTHPDTPVIFTEKNRYPEPTSAAAEFGRRASREIFITDIDGNQKIEVKHSRQRHRASSPNIIDTAANFFCYDIHPEFKLQLVPKKSCDELSSHLCGSHQQHSQHHSFQHFHHQHNHLSHHRLLKKHSSKSKSFPSVVSSSTSTPGSGRSSAASLQQHSFDSDATFSSYSVDEESEDAELDDDKVIASALLTTDLNESSTSLSSSTTSQSSKVTAVEAARKQQQQHNSSGEQVVQHISAEQYFQESGILGPMGANVSVSSILKKSSKIKPILSDSHTKKQIRKTSLVLFGGQKQGGNGNGNHHTNGHAFDGDNQAEADRRRSISESYECHPDNLRPLSLHDEIRQLKLTIKTRDDEIDKLKHEIHKLKSVLQQQATSNFNCECNFSSPQAALPALNETTAHHHRTNNDSNNNHQHHPSSELTSSSSSTSSSSKTNRSTSNQRGHQLSKKRQGVSGESCNAKSLTASTDILISKHEKDFKSKQLIKDAVAENDFLKHLDCVQIRELVESMYNRNVEIGEYVVRENEPGNHLFVSAAGEFEIIVNGKVLGTLPVGKAFGELAILYNCRRTASIKAIKVRSRVWVLDRRAFQHIMMRTGLQRIEENVKFLRSVPLLQTLDDDVLCKIADVLQLEFYPAFTYIIRQGAIGDSFFLISQGNVKVTQKIPGRLKEEEIRILGRGDYFGEQALIRKDKRSANIIAMEPGVECLTLDRDAFKQLIGNLEELQSKDYGDKDRLMKKIIDNRRKKLISETHSTPSSEYEDVELDQIESVCTVGVGGFGRVTLVKHGKNDNFKVFALKQMKKVHIVETKQEEHVFNERRIMMSLSSPFICRLYRTFRDNKYVYLLLEACMGGEVWTFLRNQGHFSESTVQFIVGCVLEAFEYLHNRGIIYRDLKPENLMLAANGYVKLVDFGFAKQIGFSTKTWTFCGTPEYVAPEIILNKGHDKAVDYWALGILISELITGAPPFRSDDSLKTYNLILKGIDIIEYPSKVSRPAVGLIKKLCKDWPADRLGCQRNGIQDIRNHKWFQGFDFDSLANLTLIPPQISNKIEGPLDLTNFDVYPAEQKEPADETSGWDEEF